MSSGAGTLDPAAGLARVRGRGAGVEGLFEDEARLARVAEIFAAMERDYLVRVPAEGDPDAVEAALRAVVSARLGLLAAP